MDVFNRWTIGHRCGSDRKKVCRERLESHLDMQAQCGAGKGLQGDMAEEHEQNFRVHQRTSTTLSEFFCPRGGNRCKLSSA